MIRINLLPYRASRKIENIRRQFSVFLLAFIVIMSGMFYYNMMLQNEIDELNAKVEDVKTEVARYEKRARRVDQIKKALETLNKKISIIKDLETKRPEAVQLLDNMTLIVAERGSSAASEGADDKESGQYKRLWFTGFQASGESVNIQGIALDNRTVADFMTRLEDSNQYANVNLKTLKHAKVRDLNLKSFEIACTKVTKAKEEKK